MPRTFLKQCMPFASDKVGQRQFELHHCPLCLRVPGEDDDVCHTSAFRITSSAEGDLSLRLVTRQAEVHLTHVVEMCRNADASWSAKSMNDSGCVGLPVFWSFWHVTWWVDLMSWRATFLRTGGGRRSWRLGAGVAGSPWHNQQTFTSWWMSYII